MILKRVIWCVVMLLTVFACNRFDGPDKPDNLISKQKMVDILIDSKLLTTGNTATKKVMRDSNVNVSTYIFKKYNIDSLQFALSNNYYAFHIDQYEEIYAMAVDSLERLGLRLKEIEAEEWKAQTKKEEDSLKLVAKKKDSLSRLGINDSILSIKILDDSLHIIKPEVKFDSIETLITPVSDTLGQL